MGRPPQFDRDDVLSRALDLFWRQGYHNVSVRELATAMGINVSTIYSEFGNKERLYNDALAKYEHEHVPAYIGALERADADVSTIAHVLYTFAEFASTGTAPGCLITNSAIEMAPDPSLSQAALLNYVTRLQRAYANALDGPGGAAGSTSAAGHGELAHALAATTLGLFVLIRAKVSGSIVREVVDATVHMLPAPPLAAATATDHIPPPTRSTPRRPTTSKGNNR